MTGTSAHGLSTRSVHAGERRDAEGAVHTPFYNHSTFAFETTADLLDVAQGRKTGNLYTRTVGMKTLSNYANHLTHTPVDPAWHDQQWTPPATTP